MVESTRREQRLDLVFSALADTTRRRIVRQLAGRPGTVTELARPHAMSLAAVSKHIGVLERAGLVTKTRVGREQRCRLKPESLTIASDAIESYRAFWEKQLDALEDFLVDARRKPGPKPKGERRGKKPS